MNADELLAAFLVADGNEHNLGTLRSAMDAEPATGSTDLTFNVFNVCVDRDREVIRLQNDLEPNEEAAVSFDRFRRMINT